MSVAMGGTDAQATADQGAAGTPLGRQDAEEPPRPALLVEIQPGLAPEVRTTTQARGGLADPQQPAQVAARRWINPAKPFPILVLDVFHENRRIIIQDLACALGDSAQ